jgi:hypothetical protein
MSGLSETQKAHKISIINHAKVVFKMGLPKSGEMFEWQRDFKIRSKPFQPPYQHKPDNDIPPNEPPFNDSKRFHTSNPDFGNHEDLKVGLGKERVKKDEKLGKNGKPNKLARE